MKRVLTVIICLSLCMLSCYGKKPPLTFDIDGLDSRAVRVSVALLGKADFGPQDIRTYQIVPNKDKFTIDSLPEVLALVYVDPWVEFHKRPGKSDEQGFGAIHLIVKPGERVAVKGAIVGNLLTYRVKGSPVNDAFAQLDTWALPMRIEMAGLWEDISVNFDKPLSDQLLADGKRIKAKADSIGKIASARFAALIEQYPDSEVSVLRLNELSPEDVVRVFPRFSQRIRQGTLGKEIDALFYRSNVIVNRDQYPAVEKGQPVEFSLTTDKGETFLPGTAGDKYVVLDFWDRGCTQCVDEMPKVEQYRRKYGDRVEFVGVGCFLSEPEWRNILDEYNIHGIQVRDVHEAAVVPGLGITSFPTKVVLDPQGREIARFEDGGEDFWQWLDIFLK